MYDKDYADFVARMGSFDDVINVDDDDEEDLKHYGILGMKWGVRKGKASGAAPVKERRMSNAELKARIKRLQLESQYETLVTANTKTTREKVERVVKDIGTVATLTESAWKIYNNVNNAVNAYNKVSKGKGK